MRKLRLKALPDIDTGRKQFGTGAVSLDLRLIMTPAGGLYAISGHLQSGQQRGSETYLNAIVGCIRIDVVTLLTAYGSDA